MTGTAATILPCHELSIADIDRLEDHLYDHNRRAVGIDDGIGLGFVARDGLGIRIGTVAGYSWAGMVEIKQLWVDEAHRGVGLGRRLVEAAIAEARRRGCRWVWVMSYDFQAPWLYEKCGFERVAEMAGWPPGHTNFALRLHLTG
jgi:GNAT superfamily N-acetyltransferase